MRKGRAEMRKGRAEMRKGRAEMRKGRAEMRKGRAEMRKGRAEMRKGRAEMRKGRAEMRKGRAEMRKGRRTGAIRQRIRAGRSGKSAANTFAANDPRTGRIWRTPMLRLRCSFAKILCRRTERVCLSIPQS